MDSNNNAFAIFQKPLTALITTVFDWTKTEIRSEQLLGIPVD